MLQKLKENWYNKQVLIKWYKKMRKKIVSNL